MQTIAPEMRAGDVVAILSNGGFGGIYEKLPARLREYWQGALNERFCVGRGRRSEKVSNSGLPFSLCGPRRWRRRPHRWRLYDIARASPESI